jgi:hypothetical protein
MQFSKSNMIAVLSIFATCSQAAPFTTSNAAFDALSTLLPREDFSNAAWDANVCKYSRNMPAYQWAVTVENDSKYDKTCGGEPLRNTSQEEINANSHTGGMLDNFRGRCGVITSWGCTWVGAAGTTALMQFWTSAFCQADDIAAAIKAASKKEVMISCDIVTSEGGDVSIDNPIAGLE